MVPSLSCIIERHPRESRFNAEADYSTGTYHDIFFSPLKRIILQFSIEITKIYSKFLLISAEKGVQFIYF